MSWRDEWRDRAEAELSEQRGEAALEVYVVCEEVAVWGKLGELNCGAASRQRRPVAPKGECLAGSSVG